MFNVRLCGNRDRQISVATERHRVLANDRACSSVGGPMPNTNGRGAMRAKFAPASRIQIPFRDQAVPNAEQRRS